METVAIVGAGQSGAALAARLRQNGFEGRISIFGDEPSPPYQRPPLSKKYLSGEWQSERLWLRGTEFWQQKNVDLLLGGSVSQIAPDTGQLIWNGEVHHWTKLALVTGATPRPLPSGLADRANVFEVRTLADVDRLRSAFLPGKRLVVVGGGYIGLETAAVAAKAGLNVTVIERAPRILERVACAATSIAIRTLHQQHGVTVLEGQEIAETYGDEKIEAISLAGGTKIDCDLVVAGVGVLPRTELAHAAGLRCDDGIFVDSLGRTSAARVWAAGDCTSFVIDGQLTRLESVQNAIDQGEAVANDMVGLGLPYLPVPWFWSDQYDLKLQIVGLNRGYDKVIELASERGRSNWYFGDGRLLAVDALNDGRAFMAAKKLLEMDAAPCEADVRHPEFNPMEFLQRNTR